MSVPLPRSVVSVCWAEQLLSFVQGLSLLRNRNADQTCVHVTQSFPLQRRRQRMTKTKAAAVKQKDIVFAGRRR